MNEPKIVSYVGFAIRMNKAIFGLESIRRAKGTVPVIVYDGGLGGDALKRIKSIEERLGSKLIKLSNPLAETFKRENLKLIGVIDKSLANAIIAVAE